MEMNATMTGHRWSPCPSNKVEHSQPDLFQSRSLTLCKKRNRPCKKRECSVWKSDARDDFCVQTPVRDAHRRVGAVLEKSRLQAQCAIEQTDSRGVTVFSGVMDPTRIGQHSR